MTIFLVPQGARRITVNGQEYRLVKNRLVPVQGKTEQ